MKYRLLLLIVIIILQLPSLQKNKNQTKLIYTMIILFLFAALRGTGDGDYYTYLERSNYIQNFNDVLNNQFPMEIGFRVLSYIKNYLSLHDQFVIISMNLISLTCIYHFIKEYSKDKMLSALLFLPLYFQFDMHAARTAVAIGISTLGYKYLREKNFFKYLLIIYLASLFHQTALILIPLYIIIDIKIPYIISIGSIFLIFIYSLLFSMNQIIYSLLKLFNMNSMSSRFSIYINSSTYGYSYKIYDPRLLLILFIFILSLYTLKKEIKLENQLINIIWVNALLLLIFRENTFFITRIVSFLNVYTLIVIPEILYKFKKEKKKYSLYKLLSIYTYIAYSMPFIISGLEYKFFFL